MKARAWVTLPGLAFGVVALLTVPAGAFPEEPGRKDRPDADLLNKASVDGKYSKLLKKIEVPQDKEAYGDFTDYGSYSGTEWAGYKDLPPGYWVYVAPHWYIWGELGEGKKGNSDPDRKKASVDGKYTRLLKRIKVEEDKETYGDFNDWGHWDGTEWAGHKDLPAGYWVYVAPHWYIWGETSDGSDAALKKASVDGKYGKLLKKIKVEEDKDSYGDFNDYGHWDGTEWAGHKDLPAGYWVYVAPHWYIWGDKLER